MNSLNYIYRVTNSNNGKVYIGKTTRNLAQRKAGHYCKARSDGACNLFHNALRKYKETDFTWDIIAVCERKEDLEFLERAFINKYNATDRNSGYNITNGGTGGDTLSRHPRLEELKKTFSARSAGKNNPMYGSARFGTLNPRAKKVKNVTTGVEFDCIRYAAKHYGISHKHISTCCKGKIKTYKGYVWAYIE